MPISTQTRSFASACPPPRTSRSSCGRSSPPSSAATASRPSACGRIPRSTSITMAPEPTVAITRVYHFSAAHRLANAAMSDAANEALYGACARLHGHNYYLEVTVTGTPDPLTGMVVDLGRLDAAVHRTLLDEVDHARLEDAPVLAGVITTGESLARAFWR